MSHIEQREFEERARLERIIEHLIQLLRESLEKKLTAVSAKGKVMPARIVVGGLGATFTFALLDVNGAIVKPAGLVNFSSDTPADATVADDSTQVLNADGSVSIQVTAVAANSDGTDSSAVITGLDPASGLAAADTLSVGVAIAVGGVAVSATGTLTVNLPPAAAAAAKTRQ